MVKFNDYEAFKSAVLENILEYMPENIRNGYKVECREVKKLDGVRDGLVIGPREGVVAVPVLYIDEMWEFYNKYPFDDSAFEFVLRDYSQIYLKHLDDGAKFDVSCLFPLKKDFVKERVIPQLVKSTDNLPDGAIYTAWNNLFVIYRVDLTGLIDTPEEARPTFVLLDTHLEDVDISNEELFAWAVDNIKQMHDYIPYVYSDVRERLGDVCRGWNGNVYDVYGLSRDDFFCLVEKCGVVVTKFFDIYESDVFSMPIRFVAGKYGDASMYMLYNEVLADAVREYDCSLYLLPYETDALIVIPENAVKFDLLTEILLETQLPDEDNIDRLYRYDKDSGVVELVNLEE